MRSSLLALLVAALALSACNDAVCTRNSDCARGLVCGDVNTCIVPPDMTTIDAGVADSSTVDQAAASDLGDAGEIPDASEVD